MELDLTGLKTWFDANAEKSKNSFWSLKGDGKQIFNNTTIKEFEPSWDLLERMLYDEAKNGVRTLQITFKASITDPTKTTKTIRIPYSFTQSIFNTNSEIKPSISGVQKKETESLFFQLMEAKLDAQKKESRRILDETLLNIEFQKALEEKEAEIKMLSENHKHWVEKLFDKLEAHPQIAGILTNKIGAAMGVQMPKISISGIDKNVPTPDLNNHENTQNTELNNSIDFNIIISACINMAQVGIENPDEKISNIAQFFIQNPALGEQMYLQLLSQNKNDG